MNINRTKKLAVCAMLSAAALIFSYVEALIPFSVGIPGVKLGFANIIVVFALYTLDEKYALAINAVRILLAGLLFGSPFSTLYAFAGGLISFGAMLLARRAKIFSVTGVSMAGGVFHNLGQILAAAWIVHTPQIILYFPLLIFSGIVAGTVNGIIVQFCLRRLIFLKRGGLYHE